MSHAEFPQKGRERAKVRSADAAVFKAVEHEAALEREAQKRQLATHAGSPRQVRKAPGTIREPHFENDTQRAREPQRVRQPQRSVGSSRTSESESRPRRGREPKSERAPKRESTPKSEKPSSKRYRKTRKEAASYGIKRKAKFTTPLLVILLLEILVSIVAVGAYTIYNEDTEMLVREHTIEAGSTADVGMYITGEPRFPDYVSCNLDFATVNYTIPQTIRFTVRMYGTNFPCVLEIVDTTAPVAEGIPQSMFSVDEIPPVEECITNIFDLNDVTVEWDYLPDITMGGNLTAKAKITDSSGNTTIVDVPFKVTRDSIAPVIEGCEDIETYIGDPIKYRENVTVTDDIDKNPTLEIDTSQVNMDEPGTYVVTYRATDFTGNVSEVDISLTLHKKPSTYVEPEVVYEEAKKILDKITDEDMTDMEKALQITWWVRYNVYYISNSDDSSWTRAAYDALVKRNGNCYNYAMCAKALFDVAGIENMIIVRDPYIHNPHYWNYINIDGQWYHCDSTPRIGYDSYFFMYTTKELKNFWHNGWNGYNFPEDSYPESATESVQSRISYSGHKIKN